MSLISNMTHVESRIFSEISHISHGFSYKSEGDMRDPVNLLRFIQTIGLSTVCFQPQQIHSDVIEVNPGTLHPSRSDGVLVFRDKSSIQTLAVLSADCVPILFTDIHNTHIGAVHSGWKGTHANIVSSMLQHIQEGGVSLDSIRICIGPHIGPCCYVVGEDRIRLFEKEYEHMTEFAYESNGEWHLDLGSLILNQLEGCGLHRYQIDTGIYCTSCQSDSFFSYRRDSKELFGEMAAVIGFT